MSSLARFLGDIAKLRKIEAPRVDANGTRAYLRHGEQAMMVFEDTAAKKIGIRAICTPAYLAQDAEWVHKPLSPDWPTEQNEDGAALWSLVMPPHSNSRLLEVSVPVEGLSDQTLNDLLSKFMRGMDAIQDA